MINNHPHNSKFFIRLAEGITIGCNSLRNSSRRRTNIGFLYLSSALVFQSADVLGETFIECQRSSKPATL
jgi:hypothetical protein